MSFKIDVDLKELNKAIKDLQTFEVVKKQAVKDAINTAALNVQKGAKKRTPVDTGRLRSSVTIEPHDKGLTLDVGTKVKYAAAVEFGTGIYSEDPDASREPIVIRPKNKKALFWPGAAHPVKKVTIKGMKARPFLFPAYEQEKPALIKSLREALKND